MSAAAPEGSASLSDEVVEKEIARLSGSLANPERFLNLEKEMKERLNVTGDKAWDMGAARLCAGLLARRAREAGHQQLTYERGKQRYEGEVKVVIDTLTEHGVEFIQYAGKRSPRFPWDKAG